MFKILRKINHNTIIKNIPSFYLQLPFYTSSPPKKYNHHHLSNKHSSHFSTTTIRAPDKLKQSVQQFLQAYQIQYKDHGNYIKLKYCPFCIKPHKNESTNHYVISVNKQYGYFHCFRCSCKGNWLQFRSRIINGQNNSNFLGSFNAFQQATTNNNKSNKISQTQYFISRSNIKREEFVQVADYIKKRGFTNQTIQAYNIGAGIQDFYDEDGNVKQIKCIYFPLYKKNSNQKTTSVQQTKNNQFTFNNNNTELVKLKIRGASKQTKKFMRQYPLKSQKGLFGFNLIKDTDKTIVLTQGQFDAMAVYQQTGLPTISLPQGASNLPEDLLNYFDNFQKIILWMDNDEVGILNTSKISQKLGINRTYVIKHNFTKLKDANDFLLQKPNSMLTLINQARTIPDSNLLNFKHLKYQIKAKLQNAQIQKGLKLLFFPYFNQKVKGVRMSQFTIVTGPTGSGKTTFLSQLCLDLCKQQIPVLFGSFQIKNEVLLLNMLNQFAGLNLTKNMQKFEYFSDSFQKLPLHLMNFYGSTNIDKILVTIIYTIQKYNIGFIVIDTLQFVLSQQGQGFKKFQIQDSFLSRLRQITIKYNVHIAIVIHPRKTQDGQDLGLHSVYGTSKATQEADNVWIIQNRDGYKIFDIKKNRYDGELGRIPIGFNKQSREFFQLTRNQFMAIKSKQKTMANISQQRKQQKMNKKQETSSIFDEDQIQDSQLSKKSKQTQNKYKKNDS